MPIEHALVHNLLDDEVGILAFLEKGHGVSMKASSSAETGPIE